MDVKRKKRSVLRRNFTNLASKVIDEVESVNPDRVSVEIKLARLENIHNDLSGLDDDILNDLLLEEADDGDLDEEKNGSETYKLEWIRIRRKMDHFRGEPSATSRSSTPSAESFANSESERRQFKLPKIELQKFNDDLRTWIGWWAQFRKIHEDQSLHDSDKFQYLIQATVTGSTARGIVENFPPSADNYGKAVEALRSHFGDEDLLVELYVRELLQLGFLSSCSKQKLSMIDLYSKIDSHLKSLESMNVTVDSYSRFLYPIVISCLSEDILRIWQRSPRFSSSKDSSDRLVGLMEFLRIEVKNDVHVSMAKEGFSRGDDKVRNSSRRMSRKRDDSAGVQHTAAGLLCTRNSCIFCDKNNHASHECRKNMSLEEKRKLIHDKKACFACLRTGHRIQNCRMNVKWLSCSKRHQIIMCPDLPGNKVNSIDQDVEVTESAANHSYVTGNVLLKTLYVRAVGPGGSRVVRLIFDDGNQRSYIKTTTATELHCPVKSHEVLRKSLFGGSITDSKRHSVHRVTLQGLHNRKRVELKLLNEDLICGRVDEVPDGPWMKELEDKGIQLTSGHSADIEILVGSDYWGELMTGRMCKLARGLVAMESLFGWTLSGAVPNADSSQGSFAMSSISLFNQTAAISDLWNLETIGIRDSIQVTTKEEKLFEIEEHFLSSISQLETGSYQVALPWKEGTNSLTHNKKIAYRRLENTTRKLEGENRFNEYEEIFESWLREGFIEDVSEKDSTKGCHFLPHRPVFKTESSTTPVRPVFDASCKTESGLSLNHCLEVGPNLIDFLPSILMRFRLRQIGVTADIRKAFQMIEVRDEDRDYLRFLWWKNKEDKSLRVFRHNRVVFGLNCSPFLLNSVIKYHLDKSEKNPAVIKQLKRSFYVDNVATSVDTEKELDRFRSTATAIMAEANMELRQWESSSLLTEPQTESSSTVVLGLNWNKEEDTFSVRFLPDVDNAVSTVTKRSILSLVSRVFDPIGFTCPVLLLPKLMLQELWATKMGWDTEIPSEQASRFHRWIREFEKLAEIQIPRHVHVGLAERIQLHCFCDASKDAYAAAVFVRVEYRDTVYTQLLQAKARIAPLSKPTIPRLELLACLIGARLLTSVREAISLQHAETFCWSDSTTALVWIKREEKWGVFVENRVQEIRKLTSPSIWQHVPGRENPADLPSRGCSPGQLVESKWWDGPAWLRQCENEWPVEPERIDEEEIMDEKRKTTKALISVSNEKTGPWYLRSSSYPKNLRVMAWVNRFSEKARKISTEVDELTVEEINRAELTVFKLIQNESFKEQMTASKLNVKVDDSGLLRVNTRLLNLNDSEFFKSPILLPSSHPVVEQLIWYEHCCNGHCGVQILMGKLREKVWIIRSRQSIRKVISRCNICKRYAAKSVEVDPAPLPTDRLTQGQTFQVVGVDLAGPLFLRDGTKTWLVLFTCAVYRCIHLEMVNSLSTEDFMMAFSRFISRRGRPTTVYSDNGTNFVGFANLTKKLDWKKIEREANVQRIQWKFNPPTAAWWGGWWERLIRMIKDLLKRMLGKRRLSYIELSTVLVEVEAIINSRPLTYVSEDDKDLVALTPAMFLNNVEQNRFPELEGSRDNMGKRFKSMCRLRKELEMRFRSEYLAMLIGRAKHSRNRSTVETNDVVLVGADNKKRLDWPMGRVLELIPGRDGKVRVAKVLTKSGVIVRPLQRLYPLEIPRT